MYVSGAGAGGVGAAAPRPPRLRRPGRRPGGGDGGGGAVAVLRGRLPRRRRARLERPVAAGRLLRAGDGAERRGRVRLRHRTRQR